MVPSITSRFSLKYMEVQGYFINDLPGLVLDGKTLEYLYVYLSPESLPVPRLETLKTLLVRSLEDYAKALKLPPFHILYLDDEGHGICATTASLKPPILISLGEGTVKGEEVPNLHLHRTYEAQGGKGVKSFRFQEKLDGYTGVEKFQGLFLRGWGGLFHHRDGEERTRVFRDFAPHKILFSSSEWVDRPVFRMQLGMNLGVEKVLFKETVLSYPEATLEEVLSLR